jgi:hypothetical protein
LGEVFAESHTEGERSWDRKVLEGPGYAVEALLMDHGTPSVAYVVRGTPRRNVDAARLAALGLRPGPWLQRVRGPQADDEEVVVVEGTARRVRELGRVPLRLPNYLRRRGGNLYLFVPGNDTHSSNDHTWSASPDTIAGVLCR